MPIFSNRSIAGMLEIIRPTIGEVKARDLRKRMVAGGDAAVAAEWEIAIVACLARQGRIEAITSKEGVRELEINYVCASGTRVAIEVTAVSDRSFHDRNPVRAFTNELLRITFKHEIHKLGAIHYHFGSKDGDKGPLLGMPSRKEMAAFFASADFKAFIASIRSAPGVPRSLQFDSHEVKSRLNFVPETRFGGGSHATFTLPSDAEDNPITSRLKSKHEQVSGSGVKLPSVVFLCDADCDLMARERVAGGTPSAAEVIDLFLNGRRPGPFQGVRSRSRRINGVVACWIKEEGSPSRGQTLTRRVVARLVPNRAQTYHPLSEQDLEEIGDCIRHMPVPARSPVNARTQYWWPAHYGGLRTAGGNLSRMKVEMSLLALQQLLAGQISTDKFARDNATLVKFIKQATDSGLIISAFNIRPCSDEDDDWVEIELNAVAPSGLFKDDPDAGTS